MVGTMRYRRKHFIDLGSDIDCILVRDEGALATSIFGSDSCRFLEFKDAGDEPSQTAECLLGVITRDQRQDCLLSFHYAWRLGPKVIPVGVHFFE